MALEGIRQVSISQGWWFEPRSEISHRLLLAHTQNFCPPTLDTLTVIRAGLNGQKLCRPGENNVPRAEGAFKPHGHCSWGTLG